MAHMRIRILNQLIINEFLPNVSRKNGVCPDFNWDHRIAKFAYTVWFCVWHTLMLGTLM